jgi:hypothetical protein
MSRLICATCTVGVECLAYALTDRDARAHGIWAGTTPKERKQLKRDGAAAA